MSTKTQEASFSQSVLTFDKYERLGDYHWQEYGGDNDYTRHVDYLVEWIGSDNHLLDVGGGDGLIASKFRDCLSVDADGIAVRLAKSHGVKSVHASAYSLSLFVGDKHDSVLLGDVLEHLEEPGKALLQCRSVLSDQGHLFVAVPPFNGELGDYHYREYTEQSLVESVSKFGFTLSGEVTQANGRLYAKFRRSALKVELGGGPRPASGFVNMDTCPTADINHNLDVYPWPVPDDSVSRVYSSHCMEHLDNPVGAFEEISRICTVGALVVIRVPDPMSEGAMCNGHKGVIGETMIRNMFEHFTDTWGGKDKILKLMSASKRPDPTWFPRARRNPLFEKWTDEDIMNWLPRTSHENEFNFRVVEWTK